MSNPPADHSNRARAHQIRRTISFASFDNLVQLHTNPDQRERFVAEVARAGRELVWRDKDDHPLYPRDGEQTFVLASKRALRKPHYPKTLTERLVHPLVHRPVRR